MLHNVPALNYDFVLQACGFCTDYSLGYSRKNPHPHDGRHAGKFHGRGGLTALEIQTGGGL